MNLTVRNMAEEVNENMPRWIADAIFDDKAMMRAFVAEDGHGVAIFVVPEQVGNQIEKILETEIYRDTHRVAVDL